MRHSPRKQSKKEPTITLINVVFLMLIFFLIAGTLAPPLDSELTLVETSGFEGREPPDALVINADGEMMYRGQPIDATSYVAEHGELREATGGLANGATEMITVRIVPDRALAAQRLLEVGHALQSAGADQVFVVTERSLE